MEIIIFLYSIKLEIRVDQWVEENVFLNTNSSYIHFRITGILSINANGDTWPGDIAIDEFSVIDGVGDDLELL